MKLKPEHIIKIKELLHENECTSPNFVVDLTEFIQDITDEAYEAGYYHCDQRNSPNYIHLRAWDRFPKELTRSIGGGELYEAMRAEVNESKRY